MAAGTTVSRLTGFVRAALLSYALGASLHSDIFAFGNTVPNALYILLAGGIFNAVLVPQLVRALRHDPDRGDAYTNRVITVAGLFLVVATALLVLAAPLIVDVATTGYDGAVRDSAIAFTRLCMPQVFFYGMYVLVGQILNARGSFGPMMWAPIANNVISVAVLIVYIGVFGQAEGNEVFGAYTSGQELLLGLGATLGIAVQLLVLVPYLRRSGFHYRPRFDLRGSGLGHTLRLGLWTVLFVVVNQIAYVVVQKLATSGTSSSTDGTGVTVYSFSFLVVMVPHSIVTVSLATAMMTTISAQADAHDRPAMARTLSSTLRAALAIIVPFVALLPVIAPDLARVLFAHGAAADVGVDAYTPTLSLFGLGILFFTIHYLVLRGFYALEQNRLVFFVQCGGQHRRRDRPGRRDLGQEHRARTRGVVRRGVRRRRHRLLPPPAAPVARAVHPAAPLLRRPPDHRDRPGDRAHLSDRTGPRRALRGPEHARRGSPAGLRRSGGRAVLLDLRPAAPDHRGQCGPGHVDPARPDLSGSYDWPHRNHHERSRNRGTAGCRTRPGPATYSPAGIGWSICSVRAGAAGSGAHTTRSSSATSRCT
ncbi:MAG TPA: murein biosynthesis integral membrane protein MurJ [Nocardioides sp.]|nr:murein biosynthesis integral membrane protein MurJ [Nocardioides sp.]